MNWQKLFGLERLYCANEKCESTATGYNSHPYCETCGLEMTPQPRCIGRPNMNMCGEYINLKRAQFWLKCNKPLHCEKCGSLWNTFFLGMSMSRTLKGMMNKIVVEQSVS